MSSIVILNTNFDERFFRNLFTVHCWRAILVEMIESSMGNLYECLTSEIVVFFLLVSETNKKGTFFLPEFEELGSFESSHVYTSEF